MDSLSTIILGISLIIIMLGMGLSLVIADFKRVVLFPKAVAVGLVNQLVLLPLIGFCIASLFDVRPEIAIGIMILAACPGGPTSNLISHLARADLALSVTLTAVSSLVTLLTIPFIINFALEYFLERGQVIQLDVLQTVIQILVIVIIPVIIGMTIRHYRPFLAQKLAKPVRIGSGIVLALIIIGLCIKERANFVNYFEQAGITTLLLNVLTLGVGYLSAKFFKLNRPQAISIAIESGIQNGTLAITIAIVLLNNTDYAIAPVVYSLIMFVTGGFLIYRGSKTRD